MSLLVHHLHLIWMGPIYATVECRRTISIGHLLVEVRFTCRMDNSCFSMNFFLRHP
uniref:Uncharacterized protein n=1 Tax=Anguilla anguilla TaxID=7936 RepID=A0A0E9WCF7_ANGAN